MTISIVEILKERKPQITTVRRRDKAKGPQHAKDVKGCESLGALGPRGMFVALVGP